MADTVIDIPGVGSVAFPDSMTPEQMTAAAAKLYQEAQPKPPKPSFMQRLGEGEMNFAEANRGLPTATKDAAIGAAKGGAKSVIGLGGFFNRVAGSPSDPALFDAARAEFATPTNDMQRLGFGVEQIAEFAALPHAKGNLLRRMVTEGAQQGALSAVQGASPTPAAVIGGGAPAVASGVSRFLGGAAPKLVRSAVKPTLEELKRQAGAAVTGTEVQAKRLVDFILDKKIATPEQAQRIVDDAEKEIDRLVGGFKGVGTDAPQRAERYLKALERSAGRQGLPGDDVAVIRAKVRELYEESPLSENVTTTVMKDSPSGLVDASGKPVQAPVEEVSRALRTDVDPAEALDLARGGGRWGNRKAWGEQKGAAREASKAVERAGRDTVKATVPGTREALREQGQAIQSRNVFQRMQHREGNREPVSPFDVTTAAVEIAHGNLPVLSLGRAWLRENKLKAGLWAKQMEEALARNDTKAVASILERVGVGGLGQMRPVPAH